MRALISQERAGHTETLGSFISILGDLGFDVDVCAANAYSYLNVYEKIGLRFRNVPEEEARDIVAARGYDAVVFNSAHLTLSSERGPFSTALLSQLSETRMNKRRVIRFHHTKRSAKASGEFSELGTTNLLRPFVQFVHTPYFRFPGHVPDPAADIRLCLLGGVYPGSLAERNVTKLEEMLSIMESEKLPLNVCWYSTDLPDSLAALPERYQNIRFRLKLNALDIIEDLNTSRPLFATLFNPGSRYHTGSLTGVVPFSISIGAPIMLDPALAELYALDEAAPVEPSTARRTVEALVSLRDGFQKRSERVQAVRDAKILHNREQFRAILGSA